MLEINPGLIFWTIVTFLAMLFILSKVAWKPLLHALTSREEQIRTALLEAEEAQAEAKKLLEENRRQLAQAEAHAQQAMREGREMGEQLKTEIVEKAHASARNMIEQAKEEIRREKDSALQELRGEVADLAVTAAGKIIDANLDVNKHRQLVDGVIKDIRPS
ncbi:MAG: F0F1 ATP synthase subunit B [Bacteroidetes bacterium]|nr:F0F1 ATP synthase subunit B [Bacteroidota bacterium]MCW5894625.1 F0F1 ATP synthase subunit B [Bacteroidota bacterium]